MAILSPSLSIRVDHGGPSVAVSVLSQWYEARAYDTKRVEIIEQRYGSYEDLPEMLQAASRTVLHHVSQGEIDRAE